MTSAYPLQWPEGWPRTKWDHRKTSSPFTTTFDRARRQLLGELRLLGAASAVISSNLPLRVDGFPYSDAARRRIDDPGVALYFTLDGRQMVIARDAYWNVHDNLRSIGLAIEHLRGLERHGGAHMMERAFGGFAALPPPEGRQEDTVDWRIELAPIPDQLAPADMLTIVEARYRQKAKEAHSDAGGSDARMIRLNAAIAQARAELKP